MKRAQILEAELAGNVALLDDLAFTDPAKWPIGQLVKSKNGQYYEWTKYGWKLAYGGFNV